MICCSLAFRLRGSMFRYDWRWKTKAFLFHKVYHILIHSFHWHAQNATIHCHSQELLPFFPVTYPFPPTSLPSSSISSFHLFRGLPLSLAASKFIYNTFLGIQFSSILCTCPNQHNLFNLTVSVIVFFFFFYHCINFFIG